MVSNASLSLLHEANLKNRASSVKITEEEVIRIISLVKGILNYEDFYNVDIVIEVSLIFKLNKSI